MKMRNCSGSRILKNSFNLLTTNQHRAEAFPENNLAFVRIPQERFTLPTGPLGMVAKTDMYDKEFRSVAAGFPGVVPMISVLSGG